LPVPEMALLPHIEPVPRCGMLNTATFTVIPCFRTLIAAWWLSVLVNASGENLAEKYLQEKGPTGYSYR